MKQMDFDNLNKAELLDEIKDKCMSRAKISYYGGLVLLLLIVVALLYTGIWVLRFNEIDDIVYFLLITLIGCATGWLVMSNYRFLKRCESIDSPDQLLFWYEKRSQTNSIYPFVVFLALAGNAICRMFTRTDINGVGLTIVIALVVLVSLLFIKRWRRGDIKSYRDKEIIEQLQELTKK